MSILSRLKRELAVGESGIGLGGRKRKTKKKHPESRRKRNRDGRFTRG